MAKRMDFIVNSIQDGDVCGLFFFSIVVMFVGDRMINGFPALRLLGLRAAAFAFVGFTASHIVNTNGSTGSDLAMAGIVGLLGAIVALGPAWIILACLGYVGRHYQNATSSARSATHNRRFRRERENAEQAKRREQLEWERQAPQRERARLEMIARQREESMKQMDAHKVRTNARADCELLYQLYAPEIDQRFPRASLDEWMNKYMGDDQSPAEIETRAEQLRKLILHHLEQVKPAPKFSSLNQLANWFQDQKSQIDTLPIEDRLRRVLIANLNVRNAELMQSIIDRA